MVELSDKLFKIHATVDDKLRYISVIEIDPDTFLQINIPPEINIGSKYFAIAKINETTYFLYGGEKNNGAALFENARLLNLNKLNLSILKI